MTGGGDPAPTMTEGVLASFEPVYVNMGLLGWSVAETDGMEVWQVARFLGSKREQFDAVPRGVRDGLRLSTDGGGRRPGKAQRGEKGSYGRFDPRRVIPRQRDPGVILTGDAAR